MPTVGNVDTADVTVVAEPEGLVAGDNAICGGIGFNDDLTIPATVNCPYYADTVDGTAEYEFFLNLRSAGGAELTEFEIDILSNGAEIPGGPHFSGTPSINSLFQSFVFRADSGDGPLILVPTPAVFELKATWSTADTVTLGTTAAAGLDCVSSPPFTPAPGVTGSVSIFCRTYNTGTFQFTSTVTSGTIDYEFLYLGVPEPLLSVSSAATSLNFDFTAVGTEGTPLTGQGTS